MRRLNIVGRRYLYATYRAPCIEPSPCSARAMRGEGAALLAPLRPSSRSLGALAEAAIGAPHGSRGGESPKKEVSQASPPHSGPQGSFAWSTGEVPSTRTHASTGRSTEKAKQMVICFICKYRMWWFFIFFGLFSKM